MELGLNDFLAELGTSTVDRLNRENKSRIIPGTQPVKEEKQVEMPRQRQERKPAPPVQKRQPEPEIIQEDNSRLDEEFIEVALDYANVIVKTVRKSFETTAEKRKVFESIRSAIDVYLGEYSPQPQRLSGSAPSLFPTQSQGKMTESEFNSMPTMSQSQVPGSIAMNDLTGQAVSLNQPAPQGIMESDLNIGVTMGADGKKHADLSRMTDVDVHSLRVLSGIEEVPK